MVLPEDLLPSKKETDEIFIQRARKADNICSIYLKTEVGDNKEMSLSSPSPKIVLWLFGCGSWSPGDFYSTTPELKQCC